MNKALQWYLFFCVCVAFGITLVATINFFGSWNDNFQFQVWGNAVGEGWIETLAFAATIPGLLYMCIKIPAELGVEKRNEKEAEEA